ncbi:Meiotically up-regulated gene 89 protein [Daldinia childiae]|uniref:Meiotically up-regulated gene 89 protein n=1 Tax=Daldinia childiae TaxID=326645 RepID=UPI00144623DF|nr:Meiotically up-regulated gene 89 protein [Daldinia childiae]KAF3058363.1 Meiotically up-regulated gene 89 protein [Daldinia childiae]
MDDSSPPESIDNTKEKKKSRRPANTAFRQQRLKAWQPILTPKTVIPLFFVIGIICAPIGGLLIYASSTVKELRIDYTDCFRNSPTNEAKLMDTSLVFPSFRDNNTINAMWQHSLTNQSYGNHLVQNLTKCTLTFAIPEEMAPPVLLYYRLENFYQNHRRYVQSFFDKQLAGDDVSLVDVFDSNCEPLATTNGTHPNSRAYYPCGLIANSLFNDTFQSPIFLNPPGSNGPEGNETYVMKNTSIAWESDKELYKPRVSTDYTGIVPPPNWQIRYPDGNYSTENPPPNLHEDEHFIVWMRTAGLPTFSKLYMRNDTSPMRIGIYSMDIIDNFRTDQYQGRKSIVITTLSVMGGKNNFLGILWLVVGGFCIVLALVFLVTNLIKPRKLGDHTYLSWNNAPSSAAAKGKGKASGPTIGMATGRDLS